MTRGDSVSGSAPGHNESGTPRALEAYNMARDLDQATNGLAVAEGAMAWPGRRQHGNSGIGSGRYVLRRKREMAGR